MWIFQMTVFYSVLLFAWPESDNAQFFYSIQRIWSRDSRDSADGLMKYYNIQSVFDTFDSLMSVWYMQRLYDVYTVCHAVLQIFVIKLLFIIIIYNKQFRIGEKERMHKKAIAKMLQHWDPIPFIL